VEEVVGDDASVVFITTPGQVCIHSFPKKQYTQELEIWNYHLPAK
jgi:hypothetical protein